MGIFSKSRAHISSVEESYFQHLCFAFKYALKCFHAGLMALIHGLIPAFFETGASDTVKKLVGVCEKDDRDL